MTMTLEPTDPPEVALGDFTPGRPVQCSTCRYWVRDDDAPGWGYCAGFVHEDDTIGIIHEDGREESDLAVLVYDYDPDMVVPQIRTQYVFYCSLWEEEKA